MTKIKIDLRTRITQENETEDFHKVASGELKREKDTLRLSYLEDDKIPVKMLLKGNQLIIKRDADEHTHSLMHFELGEKGKCRYVVSGKQMDLTSVTNVLKFEENDTQSQVQVEYDLYSGLYLIGNYAVTLIFT